MTWGWVTERIGLGSEPTAADVPDLRARGITDVLDLRGEPRAPASRRETSHASFFTGSGIRYHYVPMLDRGLPIEAAPYREGVQVMVDVLSRPGTKILVHCHAGQSRSPSMVYAYLLATGMAPDAAWALIHAHRPDALQQYFSSAAAAMRGWTPAAPRSLTAAPGAFPTRTVVALIGVTVAGTGLMWWLRTQAPAPAMPRGRSRLARG